MNDKISVHFNRSDFACRCGCGFNTVDVELLELCEDVCIFLNTPVKILSGCRCKKHADKVDDGRNRGHLIGRSVNILVESPVKVYEFMCNLKRKDKISFIAYKSYIHISNDSEGDVIREIRSNEPRLF